MRAIAGEAVKPGESIPATLMKPGTSEDISMRKSPRLQRARRPEYEVIAREASKFGTDRCACRRISVMTSWAVSASALPFRDCCVNGDGEDAAAAAAGSREVGPRSKLPQKVGDT